MLKRIRHYIMRLDEWYCSARMARISIEMYKRCKARKDHDGMTKWSLNVCSDVNNMIICEFPWLTKKFIDRHEEIISDVRRHYRLGLLKGEAG